MWIYKHSWISTENTIHYIGHIILVFPRKAPFIENSILEKLWGHGFVNIKSLKGIDNVGTYLTAYLCNLDISKFFEMSSNIDEKQKKKAIVKGARLQLYPTGVRIYRCSRGIKRPLVEKMEHYQAMKEVQRSKAYFWKNYKTYRRWKNYKYYKLSSLQQNSKIIVLI